MSVGRHGFILETKSDSLRCRDRPPHAAVPRTAPCVPSSDSVPWQNFDLGSRNVMTFTDYTPRVGISQDNYRQNRLLRGSEDNVRTQHHAGVQTAFACSQIHKLQNCELQPPVPSYVFLDAQGSVWIVVRQVKMGARCR